MTAWEGIGNVFIAAGAVLVLIGLVGVLRFRRFNMRLIASAKIDTIALLLIVTGAAFREGLSWLSAKAILIALVILLVNPIVGSALAAGRRKAYLDNWAAPGEGTHEGPDDDEEAGS